MKMILLLVFCQFSLLEAKELALTFDDSPRLGSPIWGRVERAQKIRQILKDKKVDQVLFFATPRRMNEEEIMILNNHSSSGHLIGNHSHSHLHFKDTPVKEYIDDFLISHDFLKDIPNFTQFYRFPFLDSGGKASKRSTFVETFRAMGYMHGYVTLDNSEWYLEHNLIQALKSNKKIDYEKLGQLYVETVMSDIEFFDSIARKYFDHKVKHVLLLHENEMAGLYLDKLIDKIRSEGWKIISPLEAYEDSIAEIEVNSLYSGQGKMMGLALDRNYSGPLRNPTETYENLKQKMNEREIFSAR